MGAFYGQRVEQREEVGGEHVQRILAGRSVGTPVPPGVVAQHPVLGKRRHLPLPHVEIGGERMAHRDEWR